MNENEVCLPIHTHTEAAHLVKHSNIDSNIFATVYVWNKSRILQ